MAKVDATCIQHGRKILSTGPAPGQVSRPEKYRAYFGSVSSEHLEFSNKKTQGE
jgi:hypothetical protein